MFEVRNRTPFATRLHAGHDADTRDIAIFVVKGTFRVVHGGKLEIADEQVAVASADTHHGEPGESSVRYEADIAADKPGTDVVFNGAAFAPTGLARSMTVEVRAGELAKTVAVHGDRAWTRQGGRLVPSSPATFESIPLLYERAFGGADRSHSDPRHHEFEDRNPVGVGFVATNSEKVLEGSMLPNLEDPAQPLAAPTDKPPPCSLGAVSRSWAPRRNLAGTYDDAWRKDRFPFLPTDFSPDHHRAAARGLSSRTPFVGGERIAVQGMRPMGEALAFEVPRRDLEVVFRLRGTDTAVRPVLSAITVEPDVDRVMVSWVASLSCPKRLLWLDRVLVRDRKVS